MAGTQQEGDLPHATSQGLGNAHHAHHMSSESLQLCLLGSGLILTHELILNLKGNNSYQITLADDIFIVLVYLGDLGQF